MRRIDSVLFTHSHADHIYGLDDLRAFNYLQKGEIPLYGKADVLDDLKRTFQYCFVPTQAGGGKPQLSLHEVGAYQKFQMFDLEVLPLIVFHGTLPILAYKLGANAAYVTDVSRIPEETIPHLLNLDLIFLDAVRYDPHPTHFNMAGALAMVEQRKPRRTVLIHLSHDYDHSVVNTELPEGIELGFDGMVLDVSQ